MKNTSSKKNLRFIFVRVCLCGVFLWILPTVQSVSQVSNQPEVQTRSANNWRVRLTRFFRRKPPLPQSSGGSRGPFCLLSPGMNFDQGTAELWNQRPSFIWTGRLGKIWVQEKDSNELLWQKVITTNSAADHGSGLQALRYNGPTLEAGKQYQWHAFERASDASAQQIKDFSILPSSQKGPITRAWLQEQIDLIQEQATTENQTQRRLEFFLEKDLSTDFYQILFLAAVRGQLDEEREALVKEIVEEQCRLSQSGVQ